MKGVHIETGHPVLDLMLKFQHVYVLRVGQFHETHNEKWVSLVSEIYVKMSSNKRFSATVLIFGLYVKSKHGHVLRVVQFDKIQDERRV